MLDIDEMRRYHSHLMLDEFGLRGQLKLKNAKVLCIGAGGLASALLYYLVAAGVGRIEIIDHDIVELSNLSRQILYTKNDVDKPKVIAAKNRLLQLNPNVDIQTHAVRLTPENAVDLCHGDIVADCSDNFKTKLLINDICFVKQIPLATASAAGFLGSFACFYAGYGPCYRCLFEVLDLQQQQSCQEMGVFSPLLSILGAFQASEIIKYLINIKTQFHQYIEFNALTLQQKIFTIPINPSCINQHLSHAQLQTDTPSYREIPSLDALKFHQFRLIDVRSLAEHQQFNIGGDCMPLPELYDHINQLSKSESLVLYCLTGKRSRLAAELLQQAGFNNVCSLKNGINGLF